MNKAELRNQIDVIDNQIVSLLSQRLKISKQIGYEKLRNNIELYDKEREDLLIESLCAAEVELPSEYIESIYRLLLNQTRELVLKSYKGEE